MEQKAFQDYYPDNLSYCYGCGRLNEHGLHIKSYWEGDEAVCRFTPKPYHIVRASRTRWNSSKLSKASGKIASAPAAP
jgi:hypothetical protein